MTGRRQRQAIELLNDARDRGSLLVCRDRATVRALERLMNDGLVVRPAPSVFTLKSHWDELDLLQRHVELACAVAQIHPDWVFCGATAAALLGYGPSWRHLNRLNVVVANSPARADTRFAVFHDIKLPARPNVPHPGVLVTPPERTVFDCIRTFPAAEGLAVADAATRKHRWADRHMEEILQALPDGRWHGLRRAREVARQVDGRSESGGESIARFNMMLAGFASSILQLEIPDPLRPRDDPYRVDFAWPTRRGLVVGELDGAEKYTNKRLLDGKTTLDKFREERLRESRVSASGIAVARFTFEQAKDPAQLARVLDAFGVPRRTGAWVPTRAPRGTVRMGNDHLDRYGEYLLVESTYRVLEPYSITRAEVEERRAIAHGGSIGS